MGNDRVLRKPSMNKVNQYLESDPVYRKWPSLWKID